MKTFNSLLTLAFFFGLTSHAAEVNDRGVQSMKYVQVSAENVDGVEVTFTQDVLRPDCNHQTLNAHPTKVSGNNHNWHKTLFVDTSVISTEMFCPLPAPVAETIESQSIRYDSVTNAHLEGAINLYFILPENVELRATDLNGTTVSVEDRGIQRMRHLEVSAEEVSGVEITFTQEHLRQDCNRYHMSANPTRISGNEVNWHQSLYVATSVVGTRMFCPIPNPIPETLRSETFTFDSFTNPHLNGSLLMNFIVPENVNIEALSLP